MIINDEWGFAKGQNVNQGSFFIEELTDLVEEAVVAEFERINDRGGVLGAMERQYQRSKIQDESLLYEHRKHTGEIPIIGVNTFLRPDDDSGEPQEIELRRSTPEEKDQRLVDLQQFQQSHQADTETALAKLQQVALTDGNIFRELIDTVRVASLGQITRSLYEVGGRYRRSM